MLEFFHPKFFQSNKKLLITIRWSGAEDSSHVTTSKGLHDSILPPSILLLVSMCTLLIPQHLFYPLTSLFKNCNPVRIAPASLFFLISKFIRGPPVVATIILVLDGAALGFSLGEMFFFKRHRGSMEDLGRVQVLSHHQGTTVWRKRLIRRDWVWDCHPFPFPRWCCTSFFSLFLSHTVNILNRYPLRLKVDRVRLAGYVYYIPSALPRQQQRRRYRSKRLPVALQYTHVDTR